MAYNKAQSEALDRRSYERVEILLSGMWYSDINKGVECSTVDMSMCGIRLLSYQKPKVEGVVTIILDGLKPMTGQVSRVFDDGFAVCLADQPVRETVDLAIFSRSNSSNRTANGRIYPRTIPVHKLARLTRAGRIETLARVIDVSRSGIAVETRGLSKGDCLSVGKYPGTVVRTWYCGAAIEFDELIPKERISLSLSFR